MKQDSTLGASALSQILAWAQSSHIDHRAPDEYVPERDNPYMLRWFAQRKFRVLDDYCADWLDALWPFHDHDLENAYVHRFLRSDDDRALHDHPWSWVTILLDGSYWEHIPADSNVPAGETVRHKRKAGDIVVRGDAGFPHRIELDDGRPVTTLFLTAEKSREWGFWCEHGWRHWRAFTGADSDGRIRGCE